MGNLSEREILTTMRHNLRLAIEHCGLLASSPAAGPTYKKLREELKLVEGCCRQAAYWREDTRWLQYGMMMEEAHRRSLNWLRAHHPRELFEKLADGLRALMKAIDDLRDKAPPNLGLILPEMQRDPRDFNSQILVKTPKTTRRKSGLIIPPGALH